MTLVASKLKQGSPAWLATNRYKVNDVVFYNNITWQNTTGINTEPLIGSTDWIILDKPVKELVTVQVNGNEFFLKKHVLNVNPINAEVLEPNDIIFNGFWDTTTYFTNAIYQGGDVNTRGNYIELGTIKDIVLI